MIAGLVAGGPASKLRDKLRPGDWLRSIDGQQVGRQKKEDNSLSDLILLSLLTTGVIVSTGGKFTESFNVTGGKFTESFNVTGGKFTAGTLDTGGKFIASVICRDQLTSPKRCDHRGR